MSILMRCSAFFASYTPLYILFLIKYCFSTEILYTKIFIITLISLSSISVIHIMVYMKLKMSKCKNSYFITNIKKCSNNYSEYVLTVILPLWAFDLEKEDQIISFIFIWLVLGFLYVKYNQIKYNIFDFIGYNIYSCDLYSLVKEKDGNTSEKIYADNTIAIAKGKLESCDKELVNVKKLSDDIFIVKANRL